MDRGASERLRLRPLWVLLGWGFVGLVVYLSLARAPRAVPPGAFDFGHIVAYFWLMTWFAQLHRRMATRLLLAAGFAAMGAAIEYLQGLSGFRHFDHGDMLRNCIGVGIGLAGALTPLQYTLLRLEHLISSRS